MIIGAQIRAARALVNWSAEKLAETAQLGVATVRRAESADGAPSITSANLAALQRALESAGVIFVHENGDGPGVRLRKTGAAGDAHALAHAEAAVDRHLVEVDVPEDEKGRRKRAITQVPKGLKIK